MVWSLYDPVEFKNKRDLLKRKAIWGFWHVLLPLAIGSSIYYCFCPDVLFVKKIDSFLGITRVITPTVFDSFVGKIVRFFLLDAVWAYALTNICFLIMLNNTFLCFFITVCLGVLMELAQKLRLSPGTFDVLDMIAESAGALLAVIIISKFKEVFYEQN